MFHWLDLILMQVSSFTLFYEVFKGRKIKSFGRSKMFQVNKDLFYLLQKIKKYESFKINTIFQILSYT